MRADAVSLIKEGAEQGVTCKRRGQAELRSASRAKAAGLGAIRIGLVVVIMLAVMLVAWGYYSIRTGTFDFMIPLGVMIVGLGLLWLSRGRVK